jgi:hypothetical protein
MLQREAAEGRRGGPMLDSWIDGIHPALQAGAVQVVHQDGVRLHSHANALNSSMGFAFNLFLPFRLGDPAPLAALLSTKLGRAVNVDRVVFEYDGPTEILGEVAGPAPTRDEAFTASDVAVFVHDEAGRAGIVLIEVKLTEGGFTPCGGADSRGNHRKDVCASAERFFDDPASCYLRRPFRASRDRRYWPIFEQAHGSLRAAFPGCAPTGPCPFRGHAQQLMRNHALLLGLQQSGAASFGAFGLVHHDGNPDVTTPWDEYTASVADAGVLFRAGASEVALAAGPSIGPWIINRYRLRDG